MCWLLYLQVGVVFAQLKLGEGLVTHPSPRSFLKRSFRTHRWTTCSRASGMWDVLTSISRSHPITTSMLCEFWLKQFVFGSSFPTDSDILYVLFPKKRSTACSKKSFSTAFVWGNFKMLYLGFFRHPFSGNPRIGPCHIRQTNPFGNWLLGTYEGSCVCWEAPAETSPQAVERPVEWLSGHVQQDDNVETTSHWNWEEECDLQFVAKLKWSFWIPKQLWFTVAASLGESCM